MTISELEQIGAALRRVQKDLDGVNASGNLASALDAVRAQVDNALRLVAEDFRQLEGVARDARRLAADDARLESEGR